MRTEVSSNRHSALSRGLLIGFALALTVLGASAGAGWGATFTLSGGTDVNTPIGADDLIRVYINGHLYFTDPSVYADPIAPVPIVADDGDVITVEAEDYFGYCRGLSPVYIHRVDGGCEEYDLVTNGVPGSCQSGFPPHFVFYTTSYTVDMDKFSCSAIKVLKMQPVTRGRKDPRIILLDSSNRQIAANSSDYPPEALAPGAVPSEKVVFELQKDSGESRSGRGSSAYTAYGFVEVGGGQFELVYGPRKITFPTSGRRRQATETFEVRSIKLVNWVLKAPSVKWMFFKKDELVGEDIVGKTLYFVPSKSVTWPAPLNKSGGRLEIYDIACELASGLVAPDDIRQVLEIGLYTRYTKAQRFYTCPGHFVDRKFNLTAFLPDLYADCCDMACMHVLTCGVLGVPQQMTRLFPAWGGDTLSFKPGAYVLWSYYPAGTLNWQTCPFLGVGKPFHQLSLTPDGTRLYDPLILYELSAHTFTALNGMAVSDYQQLINQTAQWITSDARIDRVD